MICTPSVSSTIHARSTQSVNASACQTREAGTTRDLNSQRWESHQSPCSLFPSSCEQGILLSQVLPNICLPERDDTGRIQLPRLGRTPRAHTKSERGVVHAQYYDTLVLWAIFTPSSHMCLQHVATVQKRHLAIGFNPDLIARMWRNDGQGGYVESEFARLCEFSEAETEGEEIVARNGSGEVGKGFANIIDS